MSYENPHLSIGELMDDVLETVNAVFQQANIALPQRQYLYMGDRGETVHDCEQVTVSLGQVYSGAPGNQEAIPSRCDDPRSAVIYVEIVRCVPDKLVQRGGRAVAPAPEAMTLNAKAQGIDLMLLMDAGLIVGEKFLNALATAAAGPSSGGYQAMILEVTLGIP